MSESNNKGLIIVVIILSLIVVGLGGYVVYDKFIKEDTKKEDKDTKSETENDKKEEENKLNLSDAEIKELAEQAYQIIGIHEGGNLSINLIDLNLYKGQTLEELTSVQKFNMIAHYEASKKPVHSACSEEKGTTFNFSDVGKTLFKDLAFLEVFKNKDGYDSVKDKFGTTIDFGFSSDDKTFTLSTGCGGEGAGGNSYSTKLMDYSVDGTKLTLRVSAVYFGYAQDATEEDWENGEYLNGYNIHDHETIVQGIHDKFDWSKYDTYTAVFDISDGGLYFEKMSKN